MLAGQGKQNKTVRVVRSYFVTCGETVMKRIVSKVIRRSYCFINSLISCSRARKTPTTPTWSEYSRPPKSDCFAKSKDARKPMKSKCILAKTESKLQISGVACSHPTSGANCVSQPIGHSVCAYLSSAYFSIEVAQTTKERNFEGGAFYLEMARLPGFVRGMVFLQSGQFSGS